MSPTAAPKRDRRAAARAKAEAQREQQRRRSRRNRILLQAGIGGVVLAIVAIVSLVIVTGTRPPAAGPRNMANGGITFTGSELTVVRTAAAAPDATPTPQSRAGGKALIQVWEDFGCPACRAFEDDNATLIRQLVASGAAEVQYRPIAFLDTHFATGDEYSSRAANAAAAVANWSPDTYLAFHARLFRDDVQPAEGGPGLSDARLAQIAQQTGATHMTQIRAAIKSRQYEDWIGARTDEFTHNTGALSAVRFPATHQYASTPTVLVNGAYWDSSTTTFGSFFTSSAGAKP